MAKRNLEYIVRVTTHEHHKKDHIPFDKRRKPTQKKLKDGAYRTRYFEGDVTRSTKVKYFHTRKEIREYLQKTFKAFKRSKQQDISVVTQLSQGRFSSRFKGQLRKEKGSKITKPARIFSFNRRTKSDDVKAKLVKHDREIGHLSIDQATDIVLRSRRKGKIKKARKKK